MNEEHTMTEAGKYLLAYYNMMNMPDAHAKALRHVTLFCMWDDIRHGMREKLAELGIEAPPINPWLFIYPADRESEEEAYIITPVRSDWMMPPAPTCPVCGIPAIPVVQVISQDECWAGFECPNLVEGKEQQEGLHYEGDPLCDLLPTDKVAIPWPFDRRASTSELEALGFTVEYI